MPLFEINWSFDDVAELVSPRNIRVLAVGVMVGFLTAIIQQVVALVPITALLSPIALHRPDIFPLVYKKLGPITDSYRIQTDSTFLPAAMAAAPYNQASAYVVLDYDTGKVIESQRADEPFAIASLTKVMTAVVALDLATPKQEITISEKAAHTIPTKIGVITGEKMTVEELLHAMLMTSANDAAQAIQDGIDQVYGEPVFIRAMNAKSSLLGLSHSSFDNPQGFDGPANFSSAKDLALLTHYALGHYPLISTIVQKEYTQLLPTATHKKFDLYNWNGLLGVYPHVLGMKIGNTAKAGMTTIVLSERDGKKILVVVLGASGVLQRDLWASELLDEGFAQSKGLPKINVTEKELRQKYDEWKYWG